MIHESHYRLHQLTLKYGDEDEREQAHETLSVMEAMAETLEREVGSFGRMEEVQLPGFLARRCVEIAKVRHGRVRRFTLRNQHGMTRTVEDEIRSTEAQYAASLIFDLPFNFSITEQQALRGGNLGGGISAFCPRPGNFSLLVGEKEPKSRRMILMWEQGPHRYLCAGWTQADRVQVPDFQRRFNRNGVLSEPYVVPSDYLRPVSEWRP